MYIRSTGLGRTRLRARIERIADKDEEIVKVKGDRDSKEIDGLKLAMKSLEPFEWDVEVIVEREDIPRLIKVILSRKTIGFLTKSLISKFIGRNSGGGS